MIKTSIGEGEKQLTVILMKKALHQISTLGFTLIEVLIVVAILGTLALIGIINYQNYLERAKVAKAKADLRVLEKEIIVYSNINDNGYPDSLQEIGMDKLTDPWGNPYQYLKIEGNTKGNVNGRCRKDHFLVPVNSDFDLYSMGPDGQSRPPFTAKASRDDIVRANNGQYVGPVAGF